MIRHTAHRRNTHSAARVVCVPIWSFQHAGPAFTKALHSRANKHARNHVYIVDTLVPIWSNMWCRLAVVARGRAGEAEHPGDNMPGRLTAGATIKHVETSPAP